MVGKLEQTRHCRGHFDLISELRISRAINILTCFHDQTGPPWEFPTTDEQVKEEEII